MERRHRGLEAEPGDAQGDARERQWVGRKRAAGERGRSRRSRSRRSRRRSAPARTAASPSRPSRRSGTSARTPASARVAASVAHSTYSGIESSSSPRNSATVFWAAASSDMPPIEVSSSACHSPCAASRAASERQASSTVQTPPATRIRFSTSDRLSMRSAPATIDFSTSHCQIVRPERRRQRHQAERRHELCADPARAEQADEQHDRRAAEQRDQRRQRGEVDMRAFEGGRGEGVHGVMRAFASVVSRPIPVSGFTRCAFARVVSPGAPAGVRPVPLANALAGSGSTPPARSPRRPWSSLRCAAAPAAGRAP